MPILAGARIDAADLVLPDPVAATGDGTNIITATTFTALPTVPCTVSITNPHPTAPMLCLVSYAAWLRSYITTTFALGNVRAALGVTGATVIPVGVGAGGTAIGWGEVLQRETDGITTSSTTNGSTQSSATVTVELNPGTSTFTFYAYRTTTAGIQNCNYPTIRVIPLRYVFS